MKPIQLIWVAFLILSGAFNHLPAASSTNVSFTHKAGSNTASKVDTFPATNSTHKNTYEVTDKETEVTLTFESESKPTEDEIDNAFSEYYRKHPDALTHKLSALVKTDTNALPRFPTEFTNRAGIVFRNVKVQQAYYDGIVVSCVNANNVWDLEKISFDELSPEIQKYYGYDPKNPAAFEERQRQLRDLNKAIWQRRWEADRPKREAEQKAMQEAREPNRKRIEALESKARAGDAEAQYELGHAYQQGQDVPKNHAEAVRWFRLAAEQGHADAQNSLGFCYIAALGVSRDLREGASWFLKAANQGDAGAQFNLGGMFFEGTVVSGSGSV